MRVIFIVGLPGSGKSFYGAHLAHYEGLAFIDDPRPETGGFPAILKTLQSHPEGGVLADPWLCLEDNRLRVQDLLLKAFPDCTFQWVFFENDPEQCSSNVESRKDSREIGDFVNFLSRRYQIPSDAQVRRVWSPK